MVLEHAGYPSSRSEEYFRDWRGGLTELASAGNTWCKISGLGMYDHRWTVESIRPWVMACLETFGVERCFFATNWPVDRLFSSYDVVIDAYAQIIADLSPSQQDALFFANATKVYSLDV
jgi:predicted TIM-barrel fold metal-dependent hydrolase